MNLSRFALIALGVLPGCLLPAAAREDAVPHAAASGDFVVGIADQLRIVVWREPELSLTVQVRPDGKITVPLIHDVEVAGHTPGEIRREITERLSALIRDPNVTVIVDQINSFRVYFLGEIQRQGAENFFRPTRLLQAIASAGGLTEFSKKKIVLVREQDGKETRREIDYKQLVSGDRGQDNVYLMPGDLVLVE